MISNRMKNLAKGSSVIRSMFEDGKILKEKYGEENVFDFSLGNPNLETPKALNEAIIKIVKEKDPNLLHGYMDNSGHFEVRDKIANHLNKIYQTDYEAKNLIMTVGAAGGLNVILNSLLNPEEEVITFSPFFSEYKHYVENFGAKLIALPPNEKNLFHPNPEALELAITEKTKVLIMNNPNNPTGVVYSEEEIKEIASVLKKKEKEYGISIYLLSDEPYRELIYDGLKLPFIPHFYENTIVCYSYSKSFSLAGERIGYLLIPNTVSHKEELLVAAKTSTRILGFVNAPSLFQFAVAESLEIKPDFSLYQKNRDILYKELSTMGYSLIKPEGAFYLFIKTPVSDVDFVKKAKEFNILLVPASAFGSPNYVRLAYCTSTETVKKSLPAFQRLAEHYRA